MIDPLNIFGEIKSVIKQKYPNALIFAFGSRTRYDSIEERKIGQRKVKWDFDVIVGNVPEVKELSNSLIEYFKGRVDENGKIIKVDLFKSLAASEQSLISKMKYGILL